MSVERRGARTDVRNVVPVKTADPAWVEAPGHGLLLSRARSRRDPLLRRLLAVADLAAAVAGVAALGAADQALWGLLVAPVWIVLAKLQGLYDRDQRALRHLTVDEAGKIAVWAVAGTGAVGAVLLAAPAQDLSIGDACRVAAVAFVFAVFLRAGARLVWRRVTPPQRTMIVGSGPLARRRAAEARALRRHPRRRRRRSARSSAPPSSAEIRRGSPASTA